MPTALYTDELAATQDEAKDLRPTFLVEAVDSGTATAQGLTHRTLAAGWPPAELNQTVFFAEAGTVGVTAVEAGTQYRAVRTTAGGIDGDWALVGGSGSADTSWVPLVAADSGVLPGAGCYDIIEPRPDVTIPTLALGEEVKVRNMTLDPVNLAGAPVMAGDPLEQILSIPAESIMMIISDGTTLRGIDLAANDVSGRYLGTFANEGAVTVPAGLAGGPAVLEGDKAKIGDAGQETLHIYADGVWIDVEEAEKITPSAAIAPTPGDDTPNSVVIPKRRDGSPLSEAHFFVGDRRAAFTARRATIVFTVSEMVGTASKAVVMPGAYSFEFVWTEDADNYYVDVAGTHVGQLDVFNSNFGVTPYYYSPTVNGVIVDTTPDPAPVDLAALTVAVSPGDQPNSQQWQSRLADGSIAQVIAGSWVVVSDGSATIIVATRVDLPAASTVTAGDEAVVLDENGARITALGTLGQPAVAWGVV